MNYSDKQIGRNIRAIRNANKQSLLDFSDTIGVSESYLEKFESGARHVPDDIIQIIADKTGVSFSEIKYGDLSSIKKGDMYFGDTISIGKFNEIFELNEILKHQFPIAENESALTDNDFKKGIEIVHNKIQKLVFSHSDCIEAINCFIRSSKNDDCSDCSAINILSCFGYLYAATVKCTVSEKEATKLEKEEINCLSGYYSAVFSSLDQNEYTKSKNIFMEKYNGILTSYMRKLIETGTHADFAYYYLCLRYCLGIMDEKITLISEEQMKVFGNSMFDSLWKMGNNYAKAFHDYLESL